jgi:hypothetical protein
MYIVYYVYNINTHDASRLVSAERVCLQLSRDTGRRARKSGRIGYAFVCQMQKGRVGHNGRHVRDS